MRDADVALMRRAWHAYSKRLAKAAVGEAFILQLLKVRPVYRLPVYCLPVYCLPACYTACYTACLLVSWGLHRQQPAAGTGCLGPAAAAHPFFQSG